jgi:hypothetical protein
LAAVVFFAAVVFLAGDFFVVLATAPVTDLTALLTLVGALAGFFLADDFFAAVFLAGDFLAAVFCAAGTCASWVAMARHCVGLHQNVGDHSVASAYDLGNIGGRGKHNRQTRRSCRGCDAPYNAPT